MLDQRPADWGDDKLSEFLDLSEQNQVATFANKKVAYHLLREVDDCVQTTIDHLIDCEPVISVFLFLRSHACYRAACRIAMAGQFSEIFPLCRVILENGLYAYHIYRNHTAEQIWIDREADEASLKLAKDEFSYGNVRRTLESDDDELATIARTLYERTISFGAHPNEQGVTASLQVFENDRTYELKQLYLHGDSTQLDLGLKTVAQCGLFPLMIAQKMWDFRIKFSGVSDRIDALKKQDL